MFKNQGKVTFEEVKAIFIIFESIFYKNHLENLNFKMPYNFIKDPKRGPCS